MTKELILDLDVCTEIEKFEQLKSQQFWWFDFKKDTILQLDNIIRATLINPDRMKYPIIPGWDEAHLYQNDEKKTA